MRKLRILLFIFPLIVSFLFLPQIVSANETGYSITIQKYRLSNGVTLSSDVPRDGSKAETITDNKGNQLEALSGISYEIVRVSPLEETREFRPVEGTDAFSTEIMTDLQGTAHVGNLSAGTYRVTEKRTEQLQNVMEPVIVELPLPQRTGNALSDVYLYPKSSIQSSQLSGTPSNRKSTLPNITGRDSEPVEERMPQTSGSLGTLQSLYILLALVLVMGTLGWYYMRSKKYHF